MLLRPGSSGDIVASTERSANSEPETPANENLQRLEFDDAENRRLTHQLFRFPAKFHAPVVRALVEAYSEPGDLILDPFCGSGTLLVEASILGRHALGTDVDPLSVFLANCKSQQFDVGELTHVSAALVESLAQEQRSQDAYRRFMQTDLSDDEWAEELAGRTPPAIPNLEHWFRRYVVVDLLQIADLVRGVQASESTLTLLWVVFASIIRGSSNADPVPVSGLERTKHMRARDAKGRLVNPYSQMSRKLRRAVQDVTAYAEARNPESRTRAAIGDATETIPLEADETPAAIITSPPYHGAVDYYRRHQLEMFWLGLTASQTERLQLLERYIGRPHVPQRHHFVRDRDLSGWAQAAACEAAIREDSPARANEFRHYCVGMGLALERFAEALTPGRPAVIIVGRSRWRGASLDTSTLFAELAGSAFTLSHHYWYPVKNRHMSYGRHNGANIDREFVLVLTRR